MKQMRFSWKGWLTPVFLLGTVAYAIAEDLTLTTYYPSPRGVYNELRTSGDVSVGTLTPPANAARLHVTQPAGGPPAVQVAVGSNAAGFVVDAGGNVGIGVVPSHDTLEVVQNVMVPAGITIDTARSAGSPQLGFRRLNSIKFAIGVDAADDKFKIGGTDVTSAHLTIDGAGNVGIGTTAPDEKLVVETTMNNDGISIRNAAGNSSYLRFFDGVGIGSQLHYIPRNDMVPRKDTLSLGSGELAFATGDVPAFPAERMRINETGNVGIGTTAPLHKLDVHGTMSLAPDTKAQLLLGRFDAAYPYAYLVAEGGGANEAGMIFRTTGQDVAGFGIWDRMTITSDGNVGVGIIPVSSSATRLHVRAPVGNGTYAIRADNPEVLGTAIRASATGANGTALEAIGPVTVAGNVSVTGTITASSSRTLKTDITYLNSQDYRGILKSLDAAHPVTYHLKDHDSFTSKPHLGVIAEEAPDEITTEDKKAISYSDYLGFLLAAMKAQQEQIKQLQGEVQRLQDRVQTGEGREP